MPIAISVRFKITSVQITSINMTRKRSLSAVNLLDVANELTLLTIGFGLVYVSLTCIYASGYSYAGTLTSCFEVVLLG